MISWVGCDDAVFREFKLLVTRYFFGPEFVDRVAIVLMVNHPSSVIMRTVVLPRCFMNGRSWAMLGVGRPA